MGFPKGQKRDFAALERRRLNGKRLLGQGVDRTEVARRLGVSYETVRRWDNMPENQLRHPGRAGRKPFLTARQQERLKRALVKGPQAHGFATSLWTCKRVASVVAGLTGRRFHRSHVWRILRGLDFSCQRPEGRARQRDEKAIERWKKRRWPALKKKPPGSAEPSSSWTKAGFPSAPASPAPGRPRAKPPSSNTPSAGRRSRRSPA